MTLGALIKSVLADIYAHGSRSLFGYAATLTSSRTSSIDACNHHVIHKHIAIALAYSPRITERSNLKLTITYPVGRCECGCSVRPTNRGSTVLRSEVVTCIDETDHAERVVAAPIGHGGDGPGERHRVCAVHLGQRLRGFTKAYVVGIAEHSEVKAMRCGVAPWIVIGAVDTTVGIGAEDRNGPVV